MRHSNFFATQKAAGFASFGKSVGGTKSEIIRKSIHFLIALTPSMAAINRPFTLGFLMIGTLGYVLMESLRLSGFNVPVVSLLTNMVSREREINRFVMGPVTLGLGALLALILFPFPVASIAIYALAFGDGFASLAGKYFGKWRPSFLYGKSIEGSFTCFFIVFVCAYLVSGSFMISAVAAFSAMVVEALPLKDYDNLAIPVTVGLAVQFALLF